MDNQKQLLFLTKDIAQKENLENLRGIEAEWKEDTAFFKFYFNDKISADDVESASDICGEIMAHFVSGFANEECIRLDYPKELPQSEFWGYIKEIKK